MLRMGPLASDNIDKPPGIGLQIYQTNTKIGGGLASPARPPYFGMYGIYLNPAAVGLLDVI